MDNSLIDLFVECGSINNACRVFSMWLRGTPSHTQEGHGTASHAQCGVKLDIDLCRYILQVFWVQVSSVTFFLPIWG